MIPTTKERSELYPAEHGERPYPFGPAQLVTGDRDEIGAAPERVREAAHGLDGVAVKERAGATGRLGDGGDRLDDAGLVVDGLEAHETNASGVSLERSVDRSRIDRAIRARGDLDHEDALLCQGARRAKDGGVLDRADDEHAAWFGEGRSQGEVVRLGPTRGQHDVSRIDLSEVTDGLTRLLDEGTRASARAVDARRIPPGVVDGASHRLARLGGERRRCVPIQIDHGRRCTMRLVIVSFGSVHVARVVVLAAALVAPGCQLVFGIDEYETAQADDGGQGGGGGVAPSTGGMPGQGGAGHGGEGAGGGSPPGCDCDVDPIWTPYTLAVHASGDSAAPTTCGNGTEPLVLYRGAPSVECSGCTCTPGGCDLPALECFDQDSCQGAAQVTTPGDGCSQMPSGGCASYKLADAISPATCTTEGNEPVGTHSFQELFAFCNEAGCGQGCAAEDHECVAAPGLTASACPAGFDFRHELDDGGQAECDACTCASECDGDPFRAGAFCDVYGISAEGCTTPAFRSYFAKRNVSVQCTTDRPDPHPGTFAVSGKHTVCCREPIELLAPSR